MLFRSNQHNSTYKSIYFGPQHFFSIGLSSVFFKARAKYRTIVVWRYYYFLSLGENMTCFDLFFRRNSESWLYLRSTLTNGRDVSFFFTLPVIPLICVKKQVKVETYDESNVLTRSLPSLHTHTFRYVVNKRKEYCAV